MELEDQQQLLVVMQLMISCLEYVPLNVHLRGKVQQSLSARVILASHNICLQPQVLCCVMLD